MKKWKRWLAYPFLAVSLITSVIAICRTCPREVTKQDLGFDYMGIIVGILSLLVTVLVGLNIYTLVDFKKKENEIDEKIKLIAESLSNLSKSELATSATTEHAISFLYYSLMGLKDPLGLEYRYLYHNLISLSKVSQLGDMKTCNAIVKGILEVVERPEDISMRKTNKDQLYIWISKVKEPMKIEKFGELIERIAKIKILN